MIWEDLTSELLPKTWETFTIEAVMDESAFYHTGQHTYPIRVEVITAIRSVQIDLRLVLAFQRVRLTPNIP